MGLAACGCASSRVDVGFKPHIQRAGGAGSDRDREQRREGDDEIRRRRRHDNARQGRENDKGHHARLQQREIIRRRRDRNARVRPSSILSVASLISCSAYCRTSQPPWPGRVARRVRPPSAELGDSAGARNSMFRAEMRGRTSNWWNGGGEGKVHSSVVAPTPQGLAPAGSSSDRRRSPRRRTPTG